MVENIIAHSQEGKLVEMKPILLQLTTNIICRMLFGKRCEKFDGFLGKNIVEFFNSVAKVARLVSKPNISDVIPILKPFDLQGLERQFKLIRNEIESCLSKIFMEYQKGNKMVDDFTTTNFVEILLNLDEKLEDKAILGIIEDFVGAGVDTSASTLEWALLELIRHPDIMKKAQEELDRVVGRNRPMFESDLPNLPYLQAIIKENFHLHPTSPVLIPHLNKKDTQISNYSIPANTIVILNVWAIGRDPKTWNKPLEFDPDRFVDSNINV
ncbi:hypothetical protein CY35_02G081600 [Sphagnum magellanicum]|nr:hypothetical protein CY35_02G081600 [Sphagnum magellanicum]